MPEVDIDIQLEKYWEIFTRQLSTDEQHKLEELLENNLPEFQEATGKHPVKAVFFASWLQIEEIIEILKPMYPYFKYIKDRFHSRLRFFAYFTLSKQKNIWKPTVVFQMMNIGC